MQAILGLAHAADTRGETDDARTMYQRVVDESPDAWLRDEARKGLESLGEGAGAGGDRLPSP
jgi:hypothetical protein